MIILLKMLCRWLDNKDVIRVDFYIKCFSLKIVPKIYFLETTKKFYTYFIKDIMVQIILIVITILSFL